ncbi:MAG: nickel-dependent lactate racemase [Bacillota bacterium]
MVELPWGKNNKISVRLPDKWVMLRELLPNPVPAVSNLEEAACAALADPVGRQPLSSMRLKEKRVTVVVDDLTRPTPVKTLLRCVLAELKLAGVDAAGVKFLIALGTHRAMTEEEIGERLGIENPEIARVYNHDCYNQHELVAVGTTAGGFPVVLNRHLVEAEIVVLVGTIEPHLLAGFSGGLKNIIPGCAGIATIAATHLTGPAAMRFKSVGLVGEECLTRRELERAALLAAKEFFIVNTVLNPDGSVAHVVAGDPIRAHRQGCRLAARIYGVKIEEKSDVVFLGSHPMDFDFRQGTKCLAHGRAAVKEGGILIAFLRCEAGLGDLRIPPAFLPLKLTRLCLTACTTDEFVTLRENVVGVLDQDTRYMLEFLTEIARYHHVLVYGPNLPEELASGLGTLELFDRVDGLMKRAAEIAPERATVYSLPFGGATYIMQS